MTPPKPLTEFAVPAQAANTPAMAVPPLEWTAATMRPRITAQLAPPYTPGRMHRQAGHRHSRAARRALRRQAAAVLTSTDPAIVAARTRLVAQLAGHSAPMIELNTLHRIALAQAAAAVHGLDVATMIQRLVDDWTAHPETQPLTGI